MTAASNSDARKRGVERSEQAAQDAQVIAQAPSSPSAAPRATDDLRGPQIANLTSEQMEALYVAGDHHPDHCDCSAYVIEQAFAEDDCCQGLLDTFAAALAIVREHRAEVLAEVERRIEAWIRHGEAVPADVTTYERWIVHDELRAFIHDAKEQNHA